MSSRMSLFLNASMVLLIAALGLLNWKFASLPIDTTPIAHDAGDAADAVGARAPGLAFADINASSGAEETLARPLFSISRRVIPAAATEAVTTGNTADEGARNAQNVLPAPLKLIGVMHIAGGEHRALLRADGKATGVWMTPGSEIDGWRLTGITGEAAVLEKAGTAERLTIQRHGNQAGN